MIEAWDTAPWLPLDFGAGWGSEGRYRAILRIRVYGSGLVLKFLHGSKYLIPVESIII